jgi:hypothetical protein
MALVVKIPRKRSKSAIIVNVDGRRFFGGMPKVLPKSLPPGVYYRLGPASYHDVQMCVTLGWMKLKKWRNEPTGWYRAPKRKNLTTGHVYHADGGVGGIPANSIDWTRVCRNPIVKLRKR